mgnify:CR=1 FL=1
MKNVGASVYDKLAKVAKNSKRPFQEVLLYYVMERFLARLSQSNERDDFILNGALMLHVLNPGLSRATRDIDFLGKFKNDLDHAEGRIRQICTIELDDGVVFDPKSIKATKIKEDAEYEGVRVEFYGKIASARVPMQIDIGFGDAVTPDPKSTQYPQILEGESFALKMYPPETVISEKFEAMVKLDMINSRMKDFFDIWFLSRSFEFSGRQLQIAIESTLMRRETDLPELPVALTDVFWSNRQKVTQWTAFRSRLNIAAPETLVDVGQEVADFLLPPLGAIREKTEFSMDWSAGHWR